MEQEIKTIPPITVAGWPTMVMPQLELHNILTYLAYKVNKPVTFGRYAADEGYSKGSVSIRIAVNDNANEHIIPKTPVHIGAKRYQLSEQQVILEPDVDVGEDKTILDEDSLTIAYVDHNRIIIPIDLTATDNQTARCVLAHIIEKVVDLVDFNVDDKILEHRNDLMQSFCQAFTANVKQRVTERQTDLKNSQRAADQAYHTIVEHERKKPVMEKEIGFLNQLCQNPNPILFRKQAKALVDLQASGDFTSIVGNDDGTIVATTSPITIEYEGWDFPLGRYTITVDNSSQVNITALDTHPHAKYPHPHVAQDGYPCLGNIAADLPKLLGSMRIAEALQLMYEFLCSYSLEGTPFEKIRMFDPTGHFVDENDDESPCENCEEHCLPYCIGGCGTNDGMYRSSDCSEYRSSFCYDECEYSQYCDLSPCDDCEDADTEHCYLECGYNDTWQEHEPCQTENCQFEECNKECPYYSKLQSLTQKETVNANAGQG